MGFDFSTDCSALQAAFTGALAGLAGNIKPLYGFDRPVLWEGAGYPGIWLECGPLEASVYGTWSPEVALDSHRIFFHHQREDGYLPCFVWEKKLGTGQIQQVVPIAATAWETYEQTGDEAFLTEAYGACARWDGWLRRYRNTRGTGLCEMFCEYDTGHDNSPRIAGIPHDCPEHDARRCPAVEGLPRLAPDLSATVYGHRVALATMARALGKAGEADRWAEEAEAVRRGILAWCFDAETASFYDVDSGGRFVRVRGDAITRVLSEHVVDQPLFGEIWSRQLSRPEAFWTPYPFPSVAGDDPAFVRPIPTNSWGGASQALTALRTPRWLEHYGHPAALAHLLGRWQEAITRRGEFKQQIDPWTGAFTSGGQGYSPAMLVLLESIVRRHGVRAAGGRLEWSCLMPAGAAVARFGTATRGGAAVLEMADGRATLTLGGRVCARVTGEARLITDAAGVPEALVGLVDTPVEVGVEWPDGRSVRHTVGPDQRVVL